MSRRDVVRILARKNTAALGDLLKPQSIITTFRDYDVISKVSGALVYELELISSLHCACIGVRACGVSDCTLGRSECMGIVRGVNVNLAYSLLILCFI